MCMGSQESSVLEEEAIDLIGAAIGLQNSINEFRDSISTYMKYKEQKRLDSKWLTTEEAIEFLNISERTLYRYRIQNIIEHKKIGKNWYYRYVGIESLLSGNKIRLDTS